MSQNVRIIYGKINKTYESLKINKKIVSLFKNDPEAYNNLGISLKNLNQTNEAITAFNNAINLKPDYAEAYYNLSNVLQIINKTDEAFQANQRAIDLGMNDPEAYFQLGNKLCNLNKVTEAINSYVISLSLDSTNELVYLNLGDCYSKLGNFHKAVSSYEKAIEIRPDYHEAFNNIGNLYTHHGHFNKAKETLERAISIKSCGAKAHYNLSRLKKFTSEDPHIETMKDLYINKKDNDSDRCLLAFALSKAYEDIDDLEQAFFYYNAGNSIRKKQVRYNIDNDINLFKKLTSNYSIFEKYSFKKENIKISQIPIFIIGMPRSGTTLVEQILSSHHDIYAGGELDYVSKYGRSIASGLTSIDKDSLVNFRNKYLKSIRELSEDSRMVTDKMFSNFIYTALLVNAFPESKIIHVKRDPSATCWSIYTKCFPLDNDDIGYSYSIETIVNYYTQYKKLMSHFIEKLSHDIYELDYESLVENSEHEIRNLIKYLDCDWDNRCLNPQDNTRAVYTASDLQVRKQIYKGSSKNWEKYKPFLNGMLDGL